MQIAVEAAQGEQSFDLFSLPLFDSLPKNIVS